MLKENVINFGLEDKNEEEMLMEVLRKSQEDIFNETEYIVKEQNDAHVERISLEVEKNCFQKEKIIFEAQIITDPPPSYSSNHSKLFSCEICGKTYDKKASFTYHMKSKHTEHKEFHCLVCGKEFPVKVDFTRHQRIHTNEKRFTCSICGKSFTDRSTHLKHEKIHLGLKPFKCQLCPKSFTHKFVLENHILVHTGLKNFPCTQCKKRFSRKIKLKEHFLRIHKRNFSVEDEEELKKLQETIEQNPEL
ncbi:gastrula zinc finger protein XlCGF42.1-like [Culicoides brevitarsis]|uniref:gastrula zinc finger protein XlCGF42.1-like n=1 Tax=Culicoides brevitarsis TaxID=469753 RepID=UPI00307BBAEF